MNCCGLGGVTDRLANGSYLRRTKTEGFSVKMNAVSVACSDIPYCVRSNVQCVLRVASPKLYPRAGATQLYFETNRQTVIRRMSQILSVPFSAHFTNP